MFAAIAAGVELANDTNAGVGVDRVLHRLVAHLATVNDLDIRTIDIADISAGQLGDERRAIGFDLPLESDVVETTIIVAIATRKANWVQLLAGAGIAKVTAPLVTLSALIDDRWPSDSAWSLVPELEDMPLGMSIAREDAGGLHDD